MIARLKDEIQVVPPGVDFLTEWNGNAEPNGVVGDLIEITETPGKPNWTTGTLLKGKYKGWYAADLSPRMHYVVISPLELLAMQAEEDNLHLTEPT